MRTKKIKVVPNDKKKLAKAKLNDLPKGETIKNEFSIFTHLKNLTVNKVPLDEKNEELVKSFDNYMVVRYISMLQMYIPICQALNLRYQTLSKSSLYTILFNTLPQRSLFFPYIKKPKNVNKKSEECLLKYFEFGSKDLEMALKILTEDQIQEVVDKFKGGKK
jgi:hypothetical protein